MGITKKKIGVTGGAKAQAKLWRKELQSVNAKKKALEAKLRTVVQRSPAYARTKGHSFEREVASLLQKIFPEARRHLEYQDGEANGVDIANTGKYLIQCKKMKNYAPLSCIDEIECEPAIGDVPVLVTAGDNKTPLACLPLEALLILIASHEGNV